MDMALEALAVDIRTLQGEGCMEPEAHAINGAARRLVVEGGGGRAESLALLHTEDGGEPVRGLRAQERERGPIAREDVLVEEAKTAIAETHGRWSKAVDVVPVQEGVLECLCSDTVGGSVVALSQEADCSDIGCLGPFTLAAEVERCNHELTQWGHERSPCRS
jgi:hypothetical protein